LPFLGNLGKDGEDALINKLNDYNDVYLLIHSGKSWQESDKFREYVRNNYEKTGEIFDFEIYYVE